MSESSQGYLRRFVLLVVVDFVKRSRLWNFLCGVSGKTCRVLIVIVRLVVRSILYNFNFVYPKLKLGKKLVV